MVENSTTGASISGWEHEGSVGDLQIRYLAAIDQEGISRIWVVGCFDKHDHPLGPPGEGSYRSELFALVWQLVCADLRAMKARAIIYFGALFRRR